VAEIIIKGMSEYCEEVRTGKFPGEEHCYRMIEGEESKFLKLMQDR
jgi:3-methyl-2-oxobutanoate hydroxymethyltransferase